MFTRPAILLIFFFGLATMAGAQVSMPGPSPNPNFPQATGPGNPQGVASALAGCSATVKRDANGYPIRQLVRDCMSSKGYSVIYQVNCSESFSPGTGWQTRTPKEVADCLYPPDNAPNNSYTFFPTPWQEEVTPVVFDPASPGPKLLLLAKQLADSDRIDDPATVANILHLTLSLSTHGENGPASCIASAYQARNSSDSYVITGNNWFHTLPSGTDLIVNPDRNDWMPGPRVETPKDIPLGAPVFTYTINSGTSCGAPSPRDGVGAGVSFDNIPAYACISGQLVRTIFPAGPADELGRTIDGPGPDIAYFHNDTRTFFSLTWPSGERPELNQPNCLQTISIGSFYKFSALHKSNFTGKHPMPDDISVPPNAPNARSPRTSPGDYLLQRVKALADNVHINNPVAASAILNMPFMLVDYNDSGTVSCSAFPNGSHFISEHYVTTSDSWYPGFDYGTDSRTGCKTSSSDFVDFGITFDNIPSYACISAQQVKSIFASVHTPSRAESQLRPDLVYVNTIAMVEFYMTTDRSVQLGGQAKCLSTIQLYAIYDLESYKRQLAQMDLAQRKLKNAGLGQHPPP